MRAKLGIDMAVERREGWTKATTHKLVPDEGTAINSMHRHLTANKGMDLSLDSSRYKGNWMRYSRLTLGWVEKHHHLTTDYR
jgi:lipocalin